MFVFDEEKTKEIDEKREAKKIALAAVKTETAEDKLANAMMKFMGGAAPKEEVESRVDSMNDLRTIIKEDDLGIRIGKDDTRAKVEAKIKEAQKK